MSVQQHRIVLTLTMLLQSVSADASIVKQACSVEIDRAKTTMAKIYRQWPLRPTADPASMALQEFTTNLAKRAGETDGREWRTYVIRDSKLNAFSVGNGHVFVTEGMLRFVDSDAELAALLTHEFAHQIAGHFCEKNGTPGFIRRIFGNRPETQGQKNIGSLTASTNPIKEEEADRIGLMILERAQYNPRAAVYLAARMLATGMPTHASTEHRLEFLQALIGARPAMYWNFKPSPAFLRIQQALSTDR